MQGMFAKAIIEGNTKSKPDWFTSTVRKEQCEACKGFSEYTFAL